MFHTETIPDVLARTASEFPARPAFSYLDETGSWSSITYEHFHQKVIHLAKALSSNGVRRGDVVAIMLPTSLHWELYHYAALESGATVVGVEPDAPREQIRYILEAAKVTVCIVSGSIDLCDFLNSELLRLVICRDSNALSYPRKTDGITVPLVKSHTELTAAQESSLVDLDSPEKEDVAWIFFSSGTTSDSIKGVCFTHSQVLHAALTMNAYIESFEELQKTVCWLPLAAPFQRIMNLFMMCRAGESGIIENPRELTKYLQEINPDFLIGVPRVYEKIFKAFQARISEKNILVRYVLDLLLASGSRDTVMGRCSRFINRFLFSSLTNTFGNRCKCLFSGSAPLSIDIVKCFSAVGMPLFEAYGLSESLLPVAINTPSCNRQGTLGRILPGHEFKLTDEGELLIKNPTITSGYLGEGHIISRNKEGFLHTGDCVEIDSDGFIRIVGRIAEFIKTSTGRKIAPREIEDKIRRCHGVDQVVLVGNNKPFLCGIVTSPEMHTDDDASVRHNVTDVLRKLSKEFSEDQSYMRLKGVVIYAGEFSLENREITRNLKIRRQSVLERFSDPVEKLYQNIENPDSDIHKSPLVISKKMILAKLPIKKDSDV